MNIAIVHPAFGVWGGAENVIQWLAHALIAREHHVTIFGGMFSPAAQQTLQRTGARVELLTFMHGSPWKRQQLSRAAARLLPLEDHVVRLDVRAIERGAPRLARQLSGFDVVNVHNFPATWWVAAAREAGRDFPPVVWSCNEPPRNLYPGWSATSPAEALPVMASPLVERDRAAGRSPDLILCVSEYVRARVAQIYSRPDAEVLHLGIPLPPAPSSADRSRTPLLLTVSRLVSTKSLDTALQALRHLPRVHLRIVGAGPDASYLRGLAQTLGVQERVTFTGFVADADLADHYAQAQVFLFLGIGEPFGLVILEASAARVPCVASNHGGPAELVVDGVTGRLVSPDDPAAIAAAVEDVLSRWDVMGAAAQARVQEHFSLHRFVTGFETRVRALIGQQEEGSPAP